MKKTIAIAILVTLILIADQSLKIWVKTNFYYGEEYRLLGLSWARLNFVENPGMAFGLELGGAWGKLILSLFRVVMIGFIVYLIRMFLRRSDSSWGLMLSLGGILAGAIGNMIDCAIYGQIFSASDPHHFNKAILFPPEGGYAPFLLGKVVDMFYFPMFDIPTWVPFLGGHKFFEPVFNIADASISVGVISLLLFQRRFFSDKQRDEYDTTTPVNDAYQETPFSDRLPSNSSPDLPLPTRTDEAAETRGDKWV